MAPTLKAAIEWIAWNDNDGDGGDESLISEYLSTALVADLFGKSQEEIARKVAKIRGK